MWPFGRGEPPGQRGEKLAVRHLRRKGFAILARNYRCPVGEADIIALDPATRRQPGGDTLTFVEVKARVGDAYAAPESAVNDRKRGQIARVARYYLSRHDAADHPVRFDVVAVLLPPDGKPQVRHIVNAFEPG